MRQTYNVRQLRLSDQILRLRPDKLLLEHGNLRALGLLVLELGDLVHDLLLAVPARLHAALHVADLLQHTPVVLQVLREAIFLLPELAQEHAQLVRDVADALVRRALAPVGQLAGDRNALAAGGLVGADGMVLGLYELVEFLRELGLLDAPQRGHGEAVLRRFLRFGGIALVGADGEGAIPGGAVRVF